METLLIATNTNGVYLWVLDNPRIVITANQRYGQNLAVTSTNVNEFGSGPILPVAVRENVWEPLKLGLISGENITGIKYFFTQGDQQAQV